LTCLEFKVVTVRRSDRPHSGIQKESKGWIMTPHLKQDKLRGKASWQMIAELRKIIEDAANPTPHALKKKRVEIIGHSPLNATRNI